METDTNNSRTTQPVGVRISKTLIREIDKYAKANNLTRAMAVGKMIEAGYPVLTGEPVPERERFDNRMMFDPQPRDLTTVSDAIRAMVRTGE